MVCRLVCRSVGWSVGSSKKIEIAIFQSVWVRLLPNFKLKSGRGQRYDTPEKFQILAAILDFGSHFCYWDISWILLKWPYISHFKSDWCQILNLSLVEVKDVTQLKKFKFWWPSWILEAILDFLEIAIFQSF